MHLRHYIQEWNIRARVELPTFPLPDGPQQREVTLYCEDRQMQITFASPEALPTVEAILTHLLFEAGLLEDRPTFPKWSQGLFDSPESSRTNDDEWMIYRRSQEQTCQLKRLLGEWLFARCLATYRTLSQERERSRAQEPHPARIAPDLVALTFRPRPLLLAAGGATELGGQVMQRLREERKAPHEEYRLAEEYILGGDHLEQMGDAAFLTWLQQMAIPLREWKERDLRVIVAVLPESVEMALKIMFYLHDALHCCPYCVILDAGGQVKRLFDLCPSRAADKRREGRENF